MPKDKKSVVENNESDDDELDNKFDHKSMAKRATRYKVPKDLQHWQTKERHCTDKPCFLIFTAMMVLCVYFGIYGYMNGNVANVLAPVDDQGRICGFDAGVEEYPYLFIWNLDAAFANPYNIFDYGTCVKECPIVDNDPIECATYDDNYRLDNCSNFITRTPAAGDWQYIYATWPALNYCYPDVDQLNEQDMASYDEFVIGLQDSMLGSWATDVWNARWVIFASIGCCLALSLVFIKLMDWFAFYIAWIAVITFEAGWVLMGFYFFNEQKTQNDSCVALLEGQELVITDAELKECNGSFWGWLLCWGLAAIYACVIVCFFKQLRQAIRVIETAADWLADTKRMIFVPLNFFLIAIIFLMFYLGAAACIGTITDGAIYHETASGDVIDYSQSKTFEWSQSTRWMLGVETFCMIWLMFFILAVNEFIIIVSAASWYFSDKTIKDDDGIAGDSNVSLGYSLAFKYHLGSLASGSLILAIIWIIRRIFEYMSKKLNDATGESCITKCFIGCCNCCLACFEKFIRYLNQQAYIYMAISGENYCTSALNAFLLMTKYAVTFGMVESLTEVFIFIVKCSIAIGTTAISFPMMSTDLVPGAQIIQQPYYPCMFILIFSYIIASIFIGMLDAGANTILQCYLLDRNIQEQMEGSGEHFDQKHISENLTRFFTDMEDKGHGKGDNAKPLLEKGKKKKDKDANTNNME